MICYPIKISLEVEGSRNEFTSVMQWHHHHTSGYFLIFCSAVFNILATNPPGHKMADKASHFYMPLMLSQRQKKSKQLSPCTCLLPWELRGKIPARDPLMVYYSDDGPQITASSSSVNWLKCKSQALFYFGIHAEQIPQWCSDTVEFDKHHPYSHFPVF